MMWIAQIALLITNFRSKDLNDNAETILYMNLISISIQSMYTFMVTCTKRALLQQNLDDCLKMNINKKYKYKDGSGDSSSAVTENSSSHDDIGADHEDDISNPVHHQSHEGTPPTVEVQLQSLQNEQISLMRRTTKLEQIIGNSSNCIDNVEAPPTTTVSRPKRDTIPPVTLMSETRNIIHTNNDLDSSDDRL